MLQVRPVYRLAVRYVTKYQCAACLNLHHFQRRMHVTPRLRTNGIPPATTVENAHASNVTGEVNEASADDGEQSAPISESRSASIAAESTAPEPHDDNSTTTAAPPSALAPLTTLARPWTSIEAKGPQTGTASINKTFHFDTFEDAFMFMTRIAFYASQINHHPRMFNFWNRVRLTLSSYDNVRKTRVVSHVDVEMGTFAERVYSSLVERRRSEIAGQEGSKEGGGGEKTKLSDILAEELIKRGNGSYAMLNNTQRQGQKKPNKSIGPEKRKATLDALRKIAKTEEK
ncbi:hypothetical protein V1508DRAFT_419747 [Lipomyces doorenjongii]|uniref:uncharacterized protein n=1 Tax=Lipomyces doorenjongii TaxID=383834 RepID=UPI0034CE5977